LPDRPGDTVAVLAEVLLVHRPAGGITALLEDGLVDGAVLDAGPVLKDGVIADAVAERRRAARVRASRRRDGVGACRLADRTQAGHREGQRHGKLEPHLEPPPRTDPVANG